MFVWIVLTNSFSDCTCFPLFREKNDGKKFSTKLKATNDNIFLIRIIHSSFLYYRIWQSPLSIWIANLVRDAWSYMHFNREMNLTFVSLYFKTCKSDVSFTSFHLKSLYLFNHSYKDLSQVNQGFYFFNWDQQKLYLARVPLLA